jgi:hypothetical protein
VDALPTLTDIYHIPVPAPGHVEIATPARGEKLPVPDQLLATGRLDALDSVGRQSPSTIGFAFNNRLLLGGFAGEPDSARGGLNPFGDPAQENLTLLLLDAHRMLTAESAELEKYPAFVKLFQDAFPKEAAQAADKNDLNLLINDQTVLRATATFLRTAVTRNTPWDKFLAGDNRALTAAQRRGAKLFFTPATAGGAGCFSCHSGPMLNKQHDDPDVAGIGQFVEENFINVGIGDHPLQALGRLVRNDPNFHDEGRKEITFNDDDPFKFRVVTLRQLKDARTFFHNGSFTKVRDVVEYFNSGVPQDPVAGAARTLSTRFTKPRGPGLPRGLGLSEQEVNDLSDFLENGLYDQALRSAVDRAAKCFEGFFFGRFDLRTPSVADLQNGRFEILELNGVTAEATHIYDPFVTLREAYRVMFRQWRIAFEIGAANRASGFQPMNLGDLIRVIVTRRADPAVCATADPAKNLVGSEYFAGKTGY